MPLLFPTQGTLSEVFAPSYPFASSRPNTSDSKPKRSPLFSAWSTADDVKSKANELSDAAAAEYTKASNKAQATTGKIELYSPKYYAACTFGGLMACVCCLCARIGRIY